MTSNDDFSDVVPGTLTSNKHSPKPRRGDFRGVLVSAPRRVVLRPGAVIPICGFYLVPAAALVGDHAPPGGIRLIVESATSGLAVTSRLVPPDPIEPEPGGDAPGPAELGDLLRGGYFNPDLIDHVSLPWRPGRYAVRAELAGYTSNVVRIELALEPEPNR